MRSDPGWQQLSGRTTVMQRQKHHHPTAAFWASLEIRKRTQRVNIMNEGGECSYFTFLSHVTFETDSVVVWIRLSRKHKQKKQKKNKKFAA